MNRTIFALFGSVLLISSSAQAQSSQRDTLNVIIRDVLDGAKPVPDPATVHASPIVVGVAWPSDLAHHRYVIAQNDATGSTPIAAVGQSVALLRDRAPAIVRPVVARQLVTIADACGNKPTQRWFYMLSGVADTTARSVVAVAVPAQTPKALPRVAQPESGPVATWGPYKWHVKRLGGACD